MLDIVGDTVAAATTIPSVRAAYVLLLLLLQLLLLNCSYTYVYM
jgi:hypothetical protein